MTKDEAINVLRSCLSQTSWDATQRLAEAIESLGNDAVPTIKQLAEDKRELANAIGA